MKKNVISLAFAVVGMTAIVYVVKRIAQQHQ